VGVRELECKRDIKLKRREQAIKRAREQRAKEQKGQNIACSIGNASMDQPASFSYGSILKQSCIVSFVFDELLFGQLSPRHGTEEWIIIVDLYSRQSRCIVLPILFLLF
jgi:hypothetical protein